MLKTPRVVFAFATRRVGRCHVSHWLMPRVTSPIVKRRQKIVSTLTKFCLNVTRRLATFDNENKNRLVVSG